MKKLLFLIASSLVFFVPAAHAVVVEDGVMLRDSNGLQMGTVRIRRSGDNLRVILNSDELLANHVYQLVVRIHNIPSQCKTSPCTSADMPAVGGSPVSESSSLLLSAEVVPSGSTTLFGRLYEGPAGIANRDVLQGYGLTNLFGAEVEVILRDMGVASQDGTILLSQLNSITADGRCGVSLTCTNIATSSFQ